MHSHRCSYRLRNVRTGYRALVIIVFDAHARVELVSLATPFFLLGLKGVASETRVELDGSPDWSASRWV
jgi:hypothetical protein